MNTGRTTIHDEVDIESIRPIHEHVLLKLIERERSVLGLYLPGNKGTECFIGEVIAVGTEIPNTAHAKGYPIEYKPGDVVLIMDYMGERFENSNGKYRFVKAQYIWATLKMKDRSTYDIEEINPNFSNILIEPYSDEISKGGIYYAEGHDSKEFGRKAVVLKVGPGVFDPETYKRVPMQVKVGDEVLMRRYAGAEVIVSGKTLRILDQGDLISVIEREA